MSPENEARLNETPGILLRLGEEAFFLAARAFCCALDHFDGVRSRLMGQPFDCRNCHGRMVYVGAVTCGACDHTKAPTLAELLGAGTIMALSLGAAVTMLVLSGCAHRESQGSRDRLYCRYAAKHTPSLSPAQLEAALGRCEK